MEIINLTGNTVKVLSKSGKMVVYKPAYPITEVITDLPFPDNISSKEVSGLEDFTLYKQTEVVACDLPPEKEGYLFIVNHIVRVSFPYRKDLITPADLIYGDGEHPEYYNGFYINE